MQSSLSRCLKSQQFFINWLVGDHLNDDNHHTTIYHVIWDEKFMTFILSLKVCIKQNKLEKKIFLEECEVICGVCELLRWWMRAIIVTWRFFALSLAHLMCNSTLEWYREKYASSLEHYTWCHLISKPYVVKALCKCLFDVKNV
jgi:hypothetical protein